MTDRDEAAMPSSSGPWIKYSNPSPDPSPQNSSAVVGGPQARSEESDEGESAPPQTPFYRNSDLAALLDEEIVRILPATPAPAKEFAARARQRQRQILAAGCALVFFSAGTFATFRGGDGDADASLRGNAFSRRCKDDPAFVLSGSGHTCLTLVEGVGHPGIRDWGCSRPAGVGGGGEELLVKHFCRHACGTCGEGPLQGAEVETSRGDANAGESNLNIASMMEEGNEGQVNKVEDVATQVDAKVDASDDDVCEDDPTYFLDDGHLGKGHTCGTYVEHVGRPNLLDGRCNTPSGIIDNGNELLIKQFCRRSCGMCEDRS